MEVPKPKQIRKRPLRALGYTLYMDDIYDICVATDRVVPPKNAESFFMGRKHVDLMPSTFNQYVRGLLKTCGMEWEKNILPVYDSNIGCSVPCFVLATDETEEHMKFDEEILKKAKEYLGREDDPVWYVRMRK